MLKFTGQDELKSDYLALKNTGCKIFHLIRVQEASGSNPDTPTKNPVTTFVVTGFLFWLPAEGIAIGTDGAVQEANGIFQDLESTGFVGG